MRAFITCLPFTCVVALAGTALAQQQEVAPETPASTDEGEAAPAPEAATEGEAAPEASEAEVKAEPVAEPAVEPVVEPAAEPAVEPAAEPAPAPERAPGVEEIVVTGSRIPTGLDKPGTIVTITAEDFARTGLTSIGDILQRLPTSGGALNTRFNSSGNFGFPPDGGGIGAGAVQADLRFLGSKRVLVLVDGVRWVHGSSASGVASSTDLSTIPMGIVDRVEVLADGASAIYGSDAISGVINIITKEQLDGVDARAYVGGYHHGDGLTQNYDVSWGGRAEKLTMVVSFSFAQQAEVSAEDRELSKFPTPEVGRCTDKACSSGTPQGRLVARDPNTGEVVSITLNDGAGPSIAYDPANPGGPNDDYHRFGTADRFNYAPYNLVVTPSERLGLFTQLRYELAKDVNLTFRALFNSRKSKNQAAPEPLFLGTEAGGGSRADNVSIHATNKYNPFGFTVDSEGLFATRRPLEAGPRIFRQNVNTFYVYGGLDGSFRIADFGFTWDAGVVYSRNRADQIKRGAFNAAKLEMALGPAAVCDADPECVQLNFFGGQGPDGKGTITQEMLDYVTFVQKDVSQQELFDFSANLVGDLVELPGGSLAFAAGFEHRRQRGFFRPDSVVTAGDTAGIPSSPTSGSFSINEAYAEVVVPLVSGATAADLLDVSGAVRYSDYSTFGAEDTYKVGVRYRPLEDLMFRGTFAQGFRAPGIGELFGTAARFDQQISDPCSNYLAASPETIANCRALGVPDTYEQLNPQISLTVGGNEELEPETSKSYTGSLVYSPYWVRSTSWSDGLEVELTYYNIELDGAIQPDDGQLQLDECVRTQDPVFCAGISRTALGSINRFENQLTNIGGIKTDGIDATINYMAPGTPIGRFDLTLTGTFLRRFAVRFPKGEEFEETERQGKEIGDPEQAYPRFKGQAILRWGHGEWSAAWTARYTHSVTEQCRDLEADHPGLCSDPNLDNDDLSTNEFSPTVYNDVQATWVPKALDNRFHVTLGVNNLFNQDPPTCFSCALNGFDATTYDVPGIFGYVRAGVRM